MTKTQTPKRITFATTPKSAEAISRVAARRAVSEAAVLNRAAELFGWLDELDEQSGGEGMVVTPQNSVPVRVMFW